MDTSTPLEDSFVETFEVSSSSASAITMAWNIKDENIPFVKGFRLHYQKVASTYIQYGPQLRSTETEYEIGNLVADTYYKVCLVVYRNNTLPYRECTDASTTNWQLPVSIGSSIGAVLALSMIVLIVLLSRCHISLKYKGKKAKRSQKYDTISSTYHDDQFEFSETVTHGQDDDFPSEYDDEVYYEIPPIETKRTRQTQSEKPGVPNGLGRSHVHPHSFSYHHSGQRNSVGRIQCSQPHHHARQFRAYSIQSDGNVCFFNQPCSPLAKDPRKDLIDKDDIHLDETFHDGEKHFHKSSLKETSPTKYDLPIAQKVCSSGPQAFTFIDENPEVLTKDSSISTKQAETPTSISSTFKNAKLLITDIDFGDMSSFGATGGQTEDMQSKTIEMSASNRMIALPESVSFEEHTV